MRCVDRVAPPSRLALAPTPAPRDVRRVLRPPVVTPTAPAVTRQTAHFRDVKPMQLLSHNYVIWRGPSTLTCDPILVVASGKTTNRKIGAMVQLWILPEAISPLEAVQTGRDDMICGDCKLRGDGTGGQRTCYVEAYRAPNNIHQALPKARHLSVEDFARKVEGLALRIADGAGRLPRLLHGQRGLTTKGPLNGPDLATVLRADVEKVRRALVQLHEARRVEKVGGGRWVKWQVRQTRAGSTEPKEAPRAARA